MADIVTLVAQANARGPTSGFTDVPDGDVTSLSSGIDLETAAIFKPLKVGNLVLKHRLVHAALGRSRSANATESPLAAEYFRQRTTPGALMISQATGVGSPEWNAWPWAVGLKSEGQVNALRKTIDAVHSEGGFWFHQLTHVGRCTSPALVKRARDLAGFPDPPSYGYRPVSSSAVAESGINTHSGEPFGVPHALTIEEIAVLRDGFKETSQLALDAGADGIEILAGNGFLLDQFLHDNINQRTDRYGGSIENRSRFVLEVVDAVAEVFGHQRIGVRLSPFSNFHETDGSQPLDQILHLSRELALRGVAFIHVGEGRVSRNLDIAENLKRLQAKEFNPTVLIGNGGYTAVTAVLTVEKGLADAVSFGRRFISNPDLVERLKRGHPLTPYDRSTFYTHGGTGYTTYP
ncbi:NADH:flavin oxidoreductase/NADH oxidase, partial [Dactylonectria estremocensis]